MTLLVTGGTGFVMSVVAREWLDRDPAARAIILDRAGLDAMAERFFAPVRDRLTVVTADMEVARHARAMGADIALSDLFLASALGPRATTDEEKPASLSRAELEEWAKIFRQRPNDPEEPS